MAPEVYKCEPTEEYMINNFLRINQSFFLVEKEIKPRFLDLYLLEPVNPLKLVFHGTNETNLLSVLEEGLKPNEDNNVYLSTFFGKAFNYRLLHPDQHKRSGLILVDFDYIEKYVKENKGRCRHFSTLMFQNGVLGIS